jgi:hypothetical protein
MILHNDCPRCGIAFKYNQTDNHLFREQKISNKKDGYSDTIVICQECDEIEGIANFIEEKSEHRGWENAEYMAADKFGVEKTLKAIQWLDKNAAEFDVYRQWRGR